MAPMISIITTVKNGDPYLSATFDALLSQTFRDFEVCVHNDGSSDKTAEIIANYSEKFSHAGIRFCHSFEAESKGVGYGKNAAISLSSGRFLCFNDADDISLPNRLELQLNAALSVEKDPDNCFIGCNFDRIPENSTENFTKWACNLTNDQLYNQIYTTFGPTIIAPCWFIPRALYNKVGGFRQDVSTGYPEDLDFFYKALHFEPTLVKVEEKLVLYRYHLNCATLSVSEEIMWTLRIKHLEEALIKKIDAFSVWDCGRRGRKFFKSLSAESQQKIAQYCDLNQKRLARHFFEIFDDANRYVIAQIPAVPPKEVKVLPVIICEKMVFISDAFNELVDERKWTEGRDYILFN